MKPVGVGSRRGSSRTGVDRAAGLPTYNRARAQFPLTMAGSYKSHVSCVHSFLCFAVVIYVSGVRLFLRC
jgi:hypothetical protein